MNLPMSDNSYVEMSAVSSSIGMLEAYLMPSHGQPTMSEEDMKLSILAIKNALDHQMLVNHTLVERIRVLEKPKKFWKK